MKPQNEYNKDIYWIPILLALSIWLNSLHRDPVSISDCVFYPLGYEQPCAIGLQIEEQIP